MMFEGAAGERAQNASAFQVLKFVDLMASKLGNHKLMTEISNMSRLSGTISNTSGAMDIESILTNPLIKRHVEDKLKDQEIRLERHRRVDVKNTTIVANEMCIDFIKKMSIEITKKLTAEHH